MAIICHIILAQPLTYDAGLRSSWTQNPSQKHKIQSFFALYRFGQWVERTVDCAETIVQASGNVVSESFPAHPVFTKQLNRSILPCKGTLAVSIGEIRDIF